ncbi:MAG: diguanylate cyclase, partial [Gammaproteobacteria bacterium]|nr:diguanylate cyclase [Gammaproteobacteria bacterium]
AGDWMDTDNWKQKYLDQLDEIEQKERLWGALEEKLRQFISHLSLAADDSNKSLSKQLNTLRAAIRKGRTYQEMSGLLDSISKSITELDDRRKKSAALPTAGELLLQLATSIKFPRSTRHLSKEFLKNYRDINVDNLEQAASAFITMLSQALQQLLDEQKGDDEGGGGLFGKLFQKKESEAESKEHPSAAASGQNEYDPGPISIAPLLPDVEDPLEPAKRILDQLIRQLISNQAESDLLISRVARSYREGDLISLTNELTSLIGQGIDGDLSEKLSMLPAHEVLIQLLERLDIPSELNEQFDAVKKSLARGVETDKLEEVLKQIADLILAMRSRIQKEKGELEQFLKQLTERLQEIDINIQDHFQDHRNSYEDGQELHKTVDREVHQIANSVEQATDLPTLKENVQQRVETIFKHMELYQKSEAERLEKAEQKVKDLSQRLTIMQNESDRLQQKIVSERNLAMVDPLTGINNRLAYNERIESEFARWQRYQTPLTMTVWDIDKFKSVNDNYGHQAGDRVLTVVAKLLSRQIRETDFVARFGGEEFVLLMPETPLEQAQKVADNLRRSIEQCEFHFKEQRVPITISCGLAQFSKGDKVEAVFNRADKALYQAKHAGRNRCLTEQDLDSEG